VLVTCQFNYYAARNAKFEAGSSQIGTRLIQTMLQNMYLPFTCINFENGQLHIYFPYLPRCVLFDTNQFHAILKCRIHILLALAHWLFSG
jgi:hypothetical protein